MIRSRESDRHPIAMSAALVALILLWSGPNAVPAQRIITTLAGNGSSGFSGDGGPAVNAQLDRYSVYGGQAASNVYIAYNVNNRIRKVAAATTSDQGTFVSPSPFLLFGPFESETSAISVSGLAGTVSKVTATITDLSIPTQADLAFLLVGPSGQSLILMSGVAVNGATQPLTLTFDDAAPSSLANDSGSGMYKPSPLRLATFPPPAPAGPYGTALSVFNGTSPTGEWKLYAVNFHSDLGCGISGENCTVVGGWGLTVTTTGSTLNPIDDTNFFVRQQYLDFLNREPDPPGFAGWTSTINNCAPGDTSCDRIHVSQLFFQSEEFQSRGYFVYRFYPVAFGRKPDYAEFVPDLARVSGFLESNQLEAAKVAFIADFMSRGAFTSVYNSLNNQQYVAMLLSTAGVTLSSRQALIDGLNDSTLTRAQVLRQIIESTEVAAKYNHQAYAVMEYFGYLRRQPDVFYLAWIDLLDATNDPRGMVTGFVNSAEYRQRFGP